jgi:Rrf2 family cysteine metabolism transcriptional repressor
MKLSTAFKTGLRALVYLAGSGRRAVPISELAPRLGVSEPYLEQLLAPLRRDGLVRSTRGVHGGFTLGRPPERIAVAEVLRALEGPVRLCDCPDRQCGQCVRPEVWRSLEQCFEATLATLTLAHLLAPEPLELTPHAAVLPPAPLWGDGSGI